MYRTRHWQNYLSTSDCFTSSLYRSSMVCKKLFFIILMPNSVFFFLVVILVQAVYICSVFDTICITTIGSISSGSINSGNIICMAVTVFMINECPCSRKLNLQTVQKSTPIIQQIRDHGQPHPCQICWW